MGLGPGFGASYLLAAHSTGDVMLCAVVRCRWDEVLCRPTKFAFAVCANHVRAPWPRTTTRGSYWWATSDKRCGVWVSSAVQQVRQEK
jgi:hypothetical protein